MIDLVQLHQHLHDSASRYVRAGEIVPDPVPSAGDERWGLSLVIIPDKFTRQRMSACAAEIALLSANSHSVYSADDLHLTVRSLEGFANSVPERVVEAYSRRLTRALAGVGPIRVTMRGVYLTATGVVACGVPNDALRTARDRLAGDAAEHGWIQFRGGDAGRVRNTAHASLIVFGPGAERDDKLVDHVESLRGEYFGEIVASRLALVRYDVSRKSVSLRTLGHVPLDVSA